MDSNSQWDRAQAEYFIRIGELTRAKRQPCRYAPAQPSMPEGEVVPVAEDDPLPDYEVESQERGTVDS